LTNALPIRPTMRQPILDTPVPQHPILDKTSLLDLKYLTKCCHHIGQSYKALTIRAYRNGHGGPTMRRKHKTCHNHEYHNNKVMEVCNEKFRNSSFINVDMVGFNVTFEDCTFHGGRCYIDPVTVTFIRCNVGGHPNA